MDRRTGRRFLGAAAMAATVFLLTQCNLVMLFISYPLGNVKIIITLADPEEEFDLEEPHMTRDLLEYGWGVLIDKDDDPATGDAEGFDLDIRLCYISLGTAAGLPETTVSLSDLQIDDSTVGAWFEEQVFIDGEQEVDFDYLPRVSFSGDTLYIGCSSKWPAFDGIVSTYRARFYATYNDPPDPGTYLTDTVERTGNGTAEDAEGDIARGFLDIVEASIDFPRL